MKIAEIRTLLMQAPLAGETAWGGENHSSSDHTAGSRNWLFVEIVTECGLSGIGECSGWPRVVERAVADLAELLIGDDVFQSERIWQKMLNAMMGHGQTGTVGFGAMTGIDMALWDLKGKALNTPVYNLLGGKIRDQVKVYVHAGSAQSAAKAVKNGYSIVKLGGIKNIVSKTEAVRRVVGNEVDIAVDLHGPAWLSPKDAVAVGQALEPFDLLFLEDPVAPEYPEGLRAVGERVNIPLAAGERKGGIWSYRELLSLGVNVLQPDTGRCGGITQMKKIAALAEAEFATIAPHAGSLGPVGEYAALHVMASIPNCLSMERFQRDCDLKEQIIDYPIDVSGGKLVVPDRPGLGVALNKDLVKKYPSKRNVSIPGSPDSGDYENGTFNEHVYFQPKYSRASFLNSKRNTKN
ncbi:mandelate racemase/muconate lactonizing enzyme family protein [Parasalinivibrio latis]|uniref:mandelate racemase/muconate lactonizing enzyme family protein n=1 Tax=Parasalinivibrio latis TaxID=2952610 RepID=UPI0030DE22DB